MDWPDPEPGNGELLIKVSTCGVCHTELDEIEGRTPPPVLPVILGHQAVGRVAGFRTRGGRAPNRRPGGSGLDLLGLWKMSVLPQWK